MVRSELDIALLFARLVWGSIDTEDMNVECTRAQSTPTLIAMVKAT